MWRFLKKLEIELPYDPAIPLLGIHTEETRRERDTSTPMFIAALFIIARTWKQPRCPSADEWIRKLWYIYTMEYYYFFVFYIFSYLLSKTMGCFSECLMSSASIQKLFCGIYSAFKCSFDEFVGEKVFSPTYSSAILAPPPHSIPLGRPSALAPSIQYRASNLDWQLISYMIFYMFQCHSPKSSHPLPLPQSP